MLLATKFRRIHERSWRGTFWLSAIFGALLALATPRASADEWYVPSQADFDAQGGALNALESIRAQLHRHEIYLCSFFGGQGAHSSARVTGYAVTLQCPGHDEPIVVPYTSRVVSATMRGRLVVCEAREGVTYFGGVTYQPDQLNCLNTRRSYDDRDVVRRFAIAWTWLAYQYSLPQNTDSEFRQLIASAPSIDDVRRESLRRTQIQVELALHENRQIDAARLYRQALTEAPTWADGHFNQALIMGDLELFPHAIRYMQNYLVLAPDAPQARAAQDRIYQWEARRPARLQ